MKKIILKVCLLAFVVTLILLGVKISCKMKEANKQEISKADLPAYKFYPVDSLSSDPGKRSSGTCVIYFDPECEHCEYETRLIVKNIGAFNNTNIVMISANTPQKIRAFSRRLNLEKYKQFQLLWDKNYAFHNYFGYANVPSMFIYNNMNHLVKEYHGETKIEAITRYLN